MPRAFYTTLGAMTRERLASVLPLFLLVALAAAGCGDDPCEKAGKTICAKACDCRAGDECAVRSGGSLTLSFDTPDDCKGWFVTLGCYGGGSEEIDYDQCNTDLGGAMCSTNGQGEGAVDLPVSCGASATPDAAMPDAAAADGGR